MPVTSIVRVSTDALGNQSNDNSYLYDSLPAYASHQTFSADGNRIVFHSYATNLVPNDTNNGIDVFVKDLTTGAIALVSTSSASVQGNGSSFNASLSRDGTQVAFTSTATNFVTGDSTTRDIFVKNLTTGAIQLVSASAAGVRGNSECYSSVFSPDGGSIAFDSVSFNLVSGDTNGRTDIFVKDLTSGAIRRVSTGAGEVQANGDSSQPHFSPNGDRIAFVSKASNLVSGDTNSQDDIFVKDLATGAIQRVSTGASGGEGNGASGRSGFDFSPDGNRIVFSSLASNLVGDSTSGFDIFVKDLTTGAIQLVSASASGAGGVGGNSTRPVFSPDGNRVAFLSDADNLVPGDTGSTFDFFIKDLTTGAIERLETGRSPDGAPPTHAVFDPSGSRLAFDSGSPDAVPNDTNIRYDVFIATLGEPEPTTISIAATDAVKAEGNSGSTAFTFTVTRTGDTSDYSWVDLSVSSTAANVTDFVDGYFGDAGYVFFNIGETSKPVTIEVAGDRSNEADESFTVTLSNPTGAVLGTASADGTILNDDADVFNYVRRGTLKSGTVTNVETGEARSLAGFDASLTTYTATPTKFTLVGYDRAEAYVYYLKVGSDVGYRFNGIKAFDLAGGNDIIDLTNLAQPYTVPVTINAGSGNDTVWSGRGNDTIDGGEGGDRLWGGQGNDEIHSGDDEPEDGGYYDDDDYDADQLYGYAGNDTLYGNELDTLSGGEGDDRLVLLGYYLPASVDGGTGHDVLFPHGDDLIVATWSSATNGIEEIAFDDAAGETYIETLYGISEGLTLDYSGTILRNVSFILGSGLDDIIYAPTEYSNVSGAALQIEGWGGNDSIVGGPTPERIVGDENSTVHGGGGNDTILGSYHNDLAMSLYGGTGNDIFEYNGWVGNDTIFDFEQGQDLIDLSSYTNVTFASLTIASAGAGFVSISGPLNDPSRWGAGETLNITVNGTVDQFTAADFLFAS